MDSDLWISRLAAAKRHYAAHLHNNSFQSSGNFIKIFCINFVFLYYGTCVLSFEF
jgi:hypothetical protein